MTQKLSLSPRGSIIPVGTDRTPVRLLNGARNLFLTVTASARVTVTVAAATAVLNRGSAFALAQEVVLDENGTEKSICDGKVLRFSSEMNAPSALSAKRLVPLADGTLPIGVYLIEEAARMQFTWPLAADPLETAYTERNQNQAFSLMVKAVGNAVAMLVTAGPATVVVDQIAFSVVQGFQRPGVHGIKAPIFLPLIKQQTFQINGAGGSLIDYVKTTNAIRALVITQEVGGVEVGDIINAVGFRGDFREIIGPKMKLTELQYNSEFDFGGAVISGNRSHVGFNFQQFGQLSEVLSPAQDVNLRFEYDAQPSARAGQSQIRTTSFELVRDAAITAPNIPFPV